LLAQATVQIEPRGNLLLEGIQIARNSEQWAYHGKALPALALDETRRPHRRAAASRAAGKGNADEDKEN